MVYPRGFVQKKNHVLFTFFLLYRPNAVVLLNEITDLMKRYEDFFHGKGKLEIMDEFMQSSDSEIERSSSFSHRPEYSTVHPLIQVSCSAILGSKTSHK